MRTIKILSFTLAALLVSSFAAAEGKVVVFNMQAALMQTASAQKVLSELETNSDFATMKAKFESIRAELSAMQQDAQTNNMTWSADKKAEFRKNVEYKNADLKLLAEKLKTEQNAVAQRIMQELGPKAKTVLEQLVKAENIALVLDSSVAYFANVNYDITNKVTEKLNKSN